LFPLFFFWGGGEVRTTKISRFPTLLQSEELIQPDIQIPINSLQLLQQVVDRLFHLVSGIGSNTVLSGVLPLYW
jgi:hypothetical protein